MASTDTTELKNKLATTRAGGTVAQQGEAEKSVAAVVREAVDRFGIAFAEVLPAGTDPKRYARLVMVAIKTNPKLLQCFTTPEGETSVLLCAMQAASLGLEPNTPTQLCWLQPRNRKIKGGDREPDRWVVECELSIGYRGFVKLISESGKVKEIDAFAVRQGDEFDWSRGLGGNKLRYKAGDDHDEADESTLTYAVAVVRFKKKYGGGEQFVVMNRRQVLKRRAMSPSWQADQKYGKAESPWSKWPAEMWAKTALRSLVKLLDLSPEVDAAVWSDGAPLALTEGSVTALPYQEPAGELEQGKYAETVGGQFVNRTTGELTSDIPTEHIEATATEPADPPPAAAPRVDDARGAADLGPMSKAQQGMLFALLAEIGIEDRRERLTWASATLGREVATYNELTFREASTLIDAARRQTEGEPDTDSPPTETQRKQLTTELRKAGILGPQRFSWSGRRISRSISNFDDLTHAEADRLLDELANTFAEPDAPDGGEAA